MHDNMGAPNDEIKLARDAELPPNGAPDTSRRDALARSLCARICDWRRDAFDLGVLDRVLTILSREDGPSALLDRLRNDRFNLDEGDEDGQAMRRMWNAGVEHATALILADEAATVPVTRIELAGASDADQAAGIAERDAAASACVSIPRTRAVDLGGER